MDLMTLLAKLTLDKTQYDQGLNEAEKDAKNLNIATPVIPKTDNTQFKDGLKEAEETGNWFKDVRSGVWEGVKDAILVTGILTLVTSIIGAMREGISLAAKNGDAISKGAKNLGISTRAYQEYEYALGKSNLKVSDLSKTMLGLGKIFSGDLNDKQKKYVEELKEMGFVADEAAGNEANLSSMMKALAKYSGSDKGAIIDWLFGSNSNWDGYFSQTGAEIDALKQEAEDLGLIMSDESVQNAAEFTDATEKLADRLEAIKRSFGEGILPIITEAVNKLMLVIDFFTGQDTRTASEKFEDEESKYQAKIKDIEATAITANTLTQTLLSMGDPSKMDTKQLAIWKGTAESLITMIPTLSGVIDVENGTISETSEGIAEMIKQYTELEKATAYQTSKAERKNIIDQKQNKLVEEAVKANNALAEAEGKRKDAIDAYNAVLAKYDVSGLGYDATEEDIQNAMQKVYATAPLDEYGLAQASAELINAAKPLTDAINEARSAQAEVDKLTADIDEVTDEFNAWVESEGAAYEGVNEKASMAIAAVEGITNALANIPTDTTTYIHVVYDDINARPHAIGSAYIPFDNYPALLHRGEKILTATEARKENNSVDISGLEDRIVAAIRAGMAEAQVTAVVTDRQVAKGSNRYNGNELDSRRFVP